MAKTAQAHEPSMEEILASIRRIISDEQTTARPQSGRPAPRGMPRPVLAEPEPAGVEDAAGDEDEAGRGVDGFLSADLDPEAEFADDPEAAPGEEITRAIEAAKVDLDAAATDGDARDLEAPELTVADTRILSPGPDAVVTAAFNRLATTILSSQARTLEDLIQDMLRPMLRGWLDENLPTLVERLVREEIERVSRGPKR